MTLDQKRERIKELDAQIAVLTEERSRLKQEVVDIICPFKVGDRFVKGGNYNVGTWEVERVVAHTSFEWTITARYINKNGKPGSRTAKFQSFYLRDMTPLEATT